MYKYVTEHVFSNLYFKIENEKCSVAMFVIQTCLKAAVTEPSSIPPI